MPVTVTVVSPISVATPVMEVPSSVRDRPAGRTEPSLSAIFLTSIETGNGDQLRAGDVLAKVQDCPARRVRLFLQAIEFDGGRTGVCCAATLTA